jgi:hypothetical protein
MKSKPMLMKTFTLNTLTGLIAILVVAVN